MPNPSPFLTGPFLVGAALDGAGWHPAAWRAPAARPAELFAPGYWLDLVRTAERGGLAFATFDDALALQSVRRGVPDGRVDQVRGRLDAVLTAARVAPTTRQLGLIPVATTTHTEPFHLSKAIATLDYVSAGRAGMQVRVSGTPLEARLFGRRTLARSGEGAGAPPGSPATDPVVADLFDEAADFVEVVRRLWDSWEDDAEIRDVATGRFIDRDKLHYIDFEGRWFSVRGPSITPRPPQGQPVVAALAHVPVAYRLAARAADVVFVTPHDAADARAITAEVRAIEEGEGRSGPPLRIVADLVVFLDEAPGAAAARKERLDDLDGRPLRSDAHAFCGTPAQLAELLASWTHDRLAGFRLRPGCLPYDLDQIAERLAPLLGGSSPPAGPGLRGTFGLDRPANRYALGGAA